jgi:hypothetical protein
VTGPQYPGPQYPEQPRPEQPYPGPQYPGQQYPGPQYPGQQYPGPAYPGQPYPEQPYQGGEPYPAPPWPGGFQQYEAQQEQNRLPFEPPRPPGIRARDLHNLPAVFILLLSAGGVGYAGLFPEHWLRGVLFMAGALGLAGLFRLVLPTRQAGWLAVRGRVVDVISYVGTGGALWVVGLLLPPTRT